MSEGLFEFDDTPLSLWEKDQVAKRGSESGGDVFIVELKWDDLNRIDVGSKSTRILGAQAGEEVIEVAITFLDRSDRNFG